MPTYVNQTPSAFEREQYDANQEQIGLQNKIADTQNKINALINVGNMELAAQMASYKSKLEIRAQALTERTASIDPMIAMGNATGYFPARAIMSAANTPLPDMPAALDVQVPRTQQILAAAGIPDSVVPSVAAPGMAATAPPISATEAGRLALQARLYRGMR
jgi:hypothetical protein